MNKSACAILQLNWEIARNHVDNLGRFDLTSTCYVRFGRENITVYQLDVDGLWKKKAIPNWRGLTFPQFLEQYRKKRWVRTTSF